MSAIEPLINDEYTALPAKRTLDFILKKRENGVRGVGVYCGYAPFELIRAMNAVPVTPCAFSHNPIAAAEEVLPANLCPLIKSSYGFIKTDTCPFYALSEAIVGETTCDGKKKMFELISHIKPTHVMDLPQLPDQGEAQRNWTDMIRRLKFLETTFDTSITDASIEVQIKETNAKSRLMNRLFDYAALIPPVINWSEMYDVIALAFVSTAAELCELIEGLVEKLEARRAQGIFFGTPDSPRVMVSGCPVGGDATKVFRIIEEAGGVVVALDACTGFKCFSLQIEEDTDDPVAAIARAYLKIPCSCMTPNQRRLEKMSETISRFKPDVVVDVILHACHSYNIESYKVQRHVEEKHGLPFLKIETEYSDSDVERVRTRVEALLENG